MSNCRVDLEFPKIEVRYQHLKVETFVHTGSRALPTIPNFIFNMTEVWLPQIIVWLMGTGPIGDSFLLKSFPNIL